MKYCLDHLTRALEFAQLYNNRQLIDSIETAIDWALFEQDQKELNKQLYETKELV
jgi:hypothetical protein